MVNSSNMRSGNGRIYRMDTIELKATSSSSYDQLFDQIETVSKCKKIIENNGDPGLMPVYYRNDVTYGAKVIEAAMRILCEVD